MPNGLSSTGLTLGAAATAPLLVWLMETWSWRGTLCDMLVRRIGVRKATGYQTMVGLIGAGTMLLVGATSDSARAGRSKSRRIARGRFGTGRVNMSQFDVATIGLGAVGGAALLAGARAHARVVGFDRFSPPHVLGSTHGETRIVRAAIGEGTDYTPFAQRSFELSEQLAAETGDTLHTRCGLLLLGATLPHASHVPAGFLDTTIEAARRYSIPHEVLDARAVRERFPAFSSYDGGRAYYEPGAGMAYPERVVDAQIRRARELGAVVHVDTRVLAIASNGRAVTIDTESGRFEARRAVLAAGAWNPTFLPPAVAKRLTVTRQTLHWFEPPPLGRAFEAERMPVFIWNDFYGFPIANEGGGVKIATEMLNDAVDPEADRRPADRTDIANLEHRVRAAFPQLGRHLRAATCLYTSTPDFNFWAGPHPEHANVTVVSACSGHGFKHAAALGEAVAMEALGERATAIPEAWRFLTVQHV